MRDTDDDPHLGYRDDRTGPPTSLEDCKNSQRDDSSALVVYSFIKHLAFPRGLAETTSTLKSQSGPNQRSAEEEDALRRFWGRRRKGVTGGGNNMDGSSEENETLQGTGAVGLVLWEVEHRTA